MALEMHWRLANGEVIVGAPLSHERRQRLQTVLDAFEALIERLNAGEAVPNQQLAAAVAFFHEFEEEAGRHGAAGRARMAAADAYDAARLRLMRIDRALESLERGEAGAAGELVLSAREYTRHLR